MSRREIGMLYETQEGYENYILVSFDQRELLPAIRHGHPDKRSPDEGSEMENIEIKDRRGARIPKYIEDRLVRDERFLAKLAYHL